MSLTNTAFKTSASELFEDLQREKKKLIDLKVILDKRDTHIYPINEVPFEIPYHWVWCYLSDVSLIQEGPGIRKHQYTTSGVQFLTVTNILEGSVDLEKSKKYISKEQYKNYSHFTIRKGDIVTACSGGSWGKSAIYVLDEKLILNTSTLRLRFYNDLGDNNYLYYLTKAKYFKDSLSKYITGQQPNYGYSHYSRILIPLPPFDEQKRIVSILDKAFTVIDKAKASTEKNLQNVRELFESYLQEVFENEVFETKAIQDISKVVNGYAFSSKDFKSANKLKSIKITNVGVGEFVEEDGNYLPEKFGKQNMDVIVKEGDIVIALTRTIISNGLKVALVPKNYDGALVNQRVAALIANEDIINHKFLFNYLQTSEVSKYVLAHVNPLMQPNLSINDLKNLHVPCPSLDRQKKIVERLEKFKSEIKILENIFWKKVENLEELRKSLLERAFAGELN